MSIIKLIRDLIIAYTITKFGADCFTFADAKSVNKVKYGNFSNSRADNLGQFWSDYIYNQTHPRSYDRIHFDQSGTDWLIFVDARV